MGDGVERVWCRLILDSNRFQHGRVCAKHLHLQFVTFFLCIIYSSYGEPQISELHLSLFSIFSRKHIEFPSCYI
jgi:hypothetical protein